MTFLGRVPHHQLVDAYRRARAVLMPGVEDFGIVPVEAMACGTPVIALGDGGALDSAQDDVTGRLVPPCADDDLVARFAYAMARFDAGTYDPSVIRTSPSRMLYSYSVV